MESIQTLQRVYTVDDHFEHLSVRCPVQVWTQGFAARVGEPPRSRDELPIVGRYDHWGYLPAVPPHDHEHFEISFVIEGSAEHHTEQAVTSVGVRDVMTVAPGEVHAMTRLCGVHIIQCAYLQDWLMHSLADILADPCLTALFLPTALHSTAHRLRVPQWHIDEETFEECMLELRHLARECAAAEPSLFYMKAALFKLMMVLVRSYPRDRRDDILIPLRPDVSEAIREIEVLIISGEAFSEADLARKHRLAPDYFSRVFRQSTGRSPMAYYQQRRIHHACWQLLSTNRTITEIAYDLGFCHSAHFCTTFRRARGLTPHAYRGRYGQR